MAFALRHFASFPLLISSLQSLRGGRDIHRWVAPTLRAFKKRKENMLEEKVFPRSAFVEWNYESELYAFGKRLGEEFNRDYLKVALTEKSYIEKEGEKLKSVDIDPTLSLKDNSELVSKGEALIQSYVLRYLLTVFPKLPRPCVENILNHLLSDDVLAHVSKHIGCDDIALTEEYPPSQKTLSRMFKSVTQALADSSGEDRACRFIRDLLITQLAGQDVTKFATPEDPMKELSDALRAEGLPEPEPRIISELGKNTLLASYGIGVYCKRKMIGKGFGETPEIARDMAACDALWCRWGIPLNRRPLPFNLELPPLSSVSQQQLSS